MLTLKTNQRLLFASGIRPEILSRAGLWLCDDFHDRA
jgi:hypothetical protein